MEPISVSVFMKTAKPSWTIGAVEGFALAADQQHPAERADQPRDGKTG
jgi:hypothetical protein